jgi:glycosyltransferase involved in cell wall biosynthesis
VNRSRVCLVGIFPPPLHGMSLINEYMRKRISLTDSPIVIDFSPRTLNRSFMVRFGKIFRVIRCFFQLLSYLLADRVGSVYLGLSGGYGQVYDALFVCVSRVFGRVLYLHHHSYQYLNQFSWLAKFVFSIAGKNTVHIVACEKMARDLKRLYPVVVDARIISGIAALELWGKEVRHREQVQSIGFLSNISIEKGILEFLDVATWAERERLQVRFLLAGPYQNDEIKFMVEERIATLSNVTCMGAVYGSEKLKFFDSIDVFLFPTNYVNESEGLVIHEAMSRGVPVIAYSRGCIEEIVSDQVGLRLAPEQDYVAGACGKIKEWLSSPTSYQLASQASLNRFNKERSLHIQNMDSLCAELIGLKQSINVK